MKKFFCTLVAMLLLCCMTVALGESCKYAGQGSPCEVKWWADKEKRQHCRACFYHVEDKEDMNSHVPVTEWENCTVDESTGRCAVCGCLYQSAGSDDSAAANEKYLLEYFIIMSLEAGTAPVDASVSGGTLSIAFAKYFRNAMLERGYMTESMMVDTDYSLSLPGGTSYVYAGAPVTPAVEVTASEYGPGAFLEKNGQLTIGEPVYENNDKPGTATVKVDITVKNGKTYTLAGNFTIEGGAQERVPGDASGDDMVDITDAIYLLDHLCGGKADINQSNADVNGDGKVDVNDALLILQREAGWNVTLK